MYNYLDKFGKINPNPIQTVINTLKSYQEEIAKELKNVK
jgi:DNA-directed RNA polymerase subunit F